MSGPEWTEARRFGAEDIANWFGVEAHLVTYDLPPGYWERQLVRRIKRRGLRARLRRLRLRAARDE